MNTTAKIKSCHRRYYWNKLPYFYDYYMSELVKNYHIKRSKKTTSKKVRQIIRSNKIMCIYINPLGVKSELKPF